VPHRLFVIFAVAVLAGCTSRTTSTIPSAAEAPRPFLEVSTQVREVFRQVAVDQKFGPEWWLRVEVVWKPDAQIEVNLERKPPGAGDFVVEANGLRCVMAREQKVYLKGARVDLLWAKESAVIDVSFPNRDGRDRLAAAEWLKSENAKRKIAAKTK
jgi:hypothetical protein